jgi:uncharacterized membrane protein (DUF2068 family)
LDTIGELPELDDPTIDGYAGDLPWVRRVSLLLNLFGLVQVLGIVTLIAMAVMVPTPSESDPILAAQAADQALILQVVYAGLAGCCQLPIALLHFITAGSLSSARKWSWYVALVLSAMYVPGLCFPVGALMVYGLVQPDVRRRFLG